MWIGQLLLLQLVLPWLSQRLSWLQVIMIRRLKSEVMAQLPPKRRQVVRLPKPRPQDWPKLGTDCPACSKI